MTGRTTELGILITADGKVAVAEAGKVKESLGELGRQVEQTNRRIEQSSKQTAFAMRQLPMQMTDIVTGLASGQSPLMVLMQQGGQLKDVFGGIGPAMSAVGGYVAGMVNPFTIAAGVAAALGYALSTLGDNAEAAGARLHRALVEDTDKVVAALQTQIDKYEERNRYASMGVGLDDSVATLAARVTKENSGYRERIALLAKIGASPGADPAWLAAQQKAGAPQIAALTKAIAANNAELDKAVEKQRELNDARAAGKVGASGTPPVVKQSREFDPEGDTLFAIREAAEKLKRQGFEERDRAADKEAEALVKLTEKYVQLADPLQKYRDQLAEIEQLRKDGALSDETAAAAAHNVALALDEQIDRMYGLRDAGKELSNVSIVIDDAFQSLGDKLADFATGGKVSFGDMVNSMIRDLIRLETKANLTSIWKELGGTSGIARSLFGVGGFSAAELAAERAAFVDNASGGVYSSPSLHAYANSIVKQPTLFNFAAGAAIGRMGEELGSPGEAIMPLTRMPGGDLGVKAAGSGGMTVNIIESPGNGGKTQQGADSAGNRFFTLMVERIKSEVKQEIGGDIMSGNGVVPAAMSSRFGLSPVPV